MQPLLQKWLIFKRTKISRVLRALEYPYLRTHSLEYMKEVYKQEYNRQKSGNTHVKVHHVVAKMRAYYTKIAWYKAVTAEKGNLQLRNEIALGLLFWKFVRDIVRNETREACLGFLSLFINDSNRHVRTVAMLESLPDNVIKKVLWRGNIDFPSFEAFLRRLEPEQYELIRRTYEDFCVNAGRPYAVPEPFKRSVRDFARFVVGKNSTAKELQGTYGGENRWESKIAWAFNLLGLDFGFSLYPNGVADDTKITNKKYSRFLSIKNHISDFSVNQFDGKYWKLYKSARSNYVWCPDKEVVLKDHICPGFWGTFIVHLLFWVISPLLFGSAMTWWLHHGGVHHFSFKSFWPVLLTLFPTPILTVFGIVKMIWQFVEEHGGFIGRGLKGIVKACKRFNEKYEKEIGVALVILGVLIITVIVGFVLAGIGAMVILAWIGCMKLHVTITAAIIFNGIMAFHLVRYALGNMFKLISWRDYEDIPKWIRNVTIFGVLFWLLQIYDLHAATYVNGFVVYAARAIKYFFVDYPFSAGLVVLSILTLGSAPWISAYALKHEKNYARIRNILLYGSIAGMLVMTILFWRAMVMDEIMFDLFDHHVLAIGIEMLVVVAFMTMLIVVTHFAMTGYDAVANRRVSQEVVSSLSSLYNWEYDYKENKEYMPNYKKLLKNKWLLSLTPEQREKVLKKMGKTVQCVLKYSGSSRDKIMMRFFKHYLSKTKSDDYYMKIRKAGAQIEAARQRENTLRYAERFYFHLTTSETLDLFVDLLDGTSFAQATQNIKDRREEKRASEQLLKERRLKREAFFNKLATPFTATYRFFATMKDLWKLFNERCPYVSRSKVLE